MLFLFLQIFIHSHDGTKLLKNAKKQKKNWLVGEQCKEYHVKKKKERKKEIGRDGSAVSQGKYGLKIHI